ncbi:MAG: hypothetical protein ACERIH_07480 [Labilibaculum antarcticum]
MVKVRIPRNEDRLLGLLIKINERHETQKKKSLLNGAVNMDRLILKLNSIQSLKDIKLNGNPPLPDTKQEKASDLKFISNEIRSIRNLLVRIYPDEPNILKEWGFEPKD